MSSRANSDLSARPTSYTGQRPVYNQQTGVEGTPGVISDSPHESDDEETTLLKRELRRLRNRNKRHTPNIVSGGTYNSIATSHPRATTTTRVQFSAEGPVYHHHLVSNAAESTSTRLDQTESASAENSSMSVGPCLKAAWSIGVIITIIVLAVVFLA